MFKVVIIEDTAEGPRGRLTEVDDAGLPEGDVTIDVAWSALNYKDALAITGAAPIARSFPMVCGVDLAGTNTETGQAVLATGQGIGERHWGGLAQRARLRSEWVVPIPDGLDAHRAMQLGTAGFTAMQCVLAVTAHGVGPEDGPVLVTGAGGGVGGIAIALLAASGYTVEASTGKTAESDYLERLGAAELIDRAELSARGKPLAKQRWAAAVDTVGGQTLANVCASLNHGGIVAACGNAGGMELPATVAPFILRGVTLAGIDSVQVPRAERLEIWQQLAEAIDPAVLDLLTEDIGLTEVVDASKRLLAGEVRGRLAVDVSR